MLDLLQIPVEAVSDGLNERFARSPLEFNWHGQHQLLAV